VTQHILYVEVKPVQNSMLMPTEIALNDYKSLCAQMCM